MVLREDQSWSTARESLSDILEESEEVFPFDHLADLNSTPEIDDGRRASFGVFPFGHLFDINDEPDQQQEDVRISHISDASTHFEPSPFDDDVAGQFADDDASTWNCKLQMLPDFYEQRHPGKSCVSISQSTTPLNPGGTHADQSEEDLQRIRSPLPMDIEEGGCETSSTLESNYVHGIRLYLLTVGLCLAVFLISIDRVIVTTAIPYITSEFRSTHDIGWYGSAYLITACAFQPLYGRIYTMFSVKWSYLIALCIFELGSLLCGVAPNSLVLIIGRAVAGYGSAGILTGSFVVVASAVPLQKRPLYTAAVGIMFGVGATIGPLFGGIFTDLVSWRWCFYINLPVGAITVVAFLLFFNQKQRQQEGKPLYDKILDLDIIGNILLLGAAIMLFIALEFTTQGEAWGSLRIIGLLSGFGVTIILFIAWQWNRQDRALVPPSIIKQRSVAASCTIAFMIYGALLMHTYFLPIWFQGILGNTALRSGVNMIPYFVVNAFFTLIAGVFVSVIGYYVPPAMIGNMIATVGCGVLTLLSTDTTTAQWAGFEVLVAAGFGLSIQQGFTAVQTVLKGNDVAIGTAAVVACQSLGGAVFVSVGNGIFQNRLLEAAADNGIADVDVQQVIASGATAFRSLVPPELLPQLLEVYNDGLRRVFIAAVPLAALAFVFSCLLEWRSVKTK